MGNFDMLPSEIILDILSRLPAETVLESKLVCKPWKNLVQHPSFAQMHLNRLHSDAAENSSKLSIIIYSHEEGLREFYYTEYDDADEIVLSRKKRLNLSPEFHKCTLIGSCNGVICFKASLDGHCGPAFICNPITRECITLPSRKGKYLWSGFGYCLLTNEYKVVRICHTRKDTRKDTTKDSIFGFAEVYTVGDGNGWRRLEEMDVKWKPMERVSTCDGAFVNGALHWVNLDNGSILAFDLTNEKFSELPAPPCLYPCLTQDGFPNIHLGVLGNILRAMQYQDDHCSEMWLLKKNKDDSDWSWSKQFSFDKWVRMPFEFTKSGKVLLHGMDGGIYICDPKASSAVNDTGFRVHIIGAVLHKNTLVSLKAFGEKDTKTMEFRERA